MARSGADLRTLPGRLSRSLAPAASGRRRRWRDLGLLTLALLPFLIAAGVTLGRGGHGRWTVVQVQAAPWLEPTTPVAARVRNLVGARVELARSQVRAPAPLACSGARYQVLALPADGLFHGALAGRADAAALAAAAGLAALPADTVRVDCDNASFDFHRAGAGLVLLLDGAVVRLQRL